MADMFRVWLAVTSHTLPAVPGQASPCDAGTLRDEAEKTQKRHHGNEVCWEEAAVQRSFVGGPPERCRGPVLLEALGWWELRPGLGELELLMDPQVGTSVHHHKGLCWGPGSQDGVLIWTPTVAHQASPKASSGFSFLTSRALGQIAFGGWAGLAFPCSVAATVSSPGRYGRVCVQG